MSDPRNNSKWVNSFNILIENRQNQGRDPPNYSPTLQTGDKLFNFGSGFSEPPLLPSATKPIFATHISHNQDNWQLSLATSGNAPAPSAIKAGIPIALNNGQKVDIQQWTIMANPMF